MIMFIKFYGKWLKENKKKNADHKFWECQL